MPGKSDPIDATAVALAAIREGLDRLPVAFLDEQAHEIRVLCDYRDQLMGERTRVPRVFPMRRNRAQLGPSEGRKCAGNMVRAGTLWDPGGTLVGYLDPRELADRYALDGHEETLERQTAVLIKLAAAAAS